MIGYPFTYGDSLSSKEAFENIRKYVKLYGSIITGDVTPGIEIAPDLGAQGAVAQPSVLRANLTPSPSLHGKVSTGVGIVSLAWTEIMAVNTGNPALYIAAAALSVYFLT